MSAPRMMSFPIVFLLSVTALTFAAGQARAADLDVPTLSIERVSRSSVTVTMQAGATGAPAGIWVDWTTKAEWLASGWNGYTVYCIFNGTATLNTEGGSAYLLGPNQSVTVEVGDLFDETGVFATYTGDMDAGSEFVFRAYAVGNAQYGWSGFTPDVFVTTAAYDPQNCTYTQGYWKNHEESWPVADLTLGSVNYTAAQLLSLFNKPAKGNGLIFLAHQLIAAKLNVAQGAVASLSIQQAIADADALIGALVVPPVGSGHLSPGTASALTEILDQFNNGTTGPGHCGTTPVQTSTWGGIKRGYE